MSSVSSGLQWWGPGRRAEPPLDTGLQAERTAMAWQRTALGVGAVSALLVHHTGARTLTAIPGMIGLLVALVLLLETEHRYVRTLRRVQAGQPATSRVLVRLLTGITVLISVSALVIVALDAG